LDGGLNTYGYVGNNPLRWSDPSGLAYGDLPPSPPGYNQSTWKSGQHPTNGRWWIEDPATGNRWTAYPEDKGHWRGWRIHEPGGEKIGEWPAQNKKPWPNQTRPPYGNQSPVDPSGNAKPWDPYARPQQCPPVAPPPRVPIRLPYPLICVICDFVFPPPLEEPGA